MQPIAHSLQPTVFLFSPPGKLSPHEHQTFSTHFRALRHRRRLAFIAPPRHASPTPSANEPTYTADGELNPPTNYREWVYLTTGFDMSYNPAMNMDHHMFDNVFVNPEAYQAFLKTGTWPDKTMLVLEVRGAQSKGSINQAGNFQDTEVMGMEVHVKDDARFQDQGNWAFFGFDGDKPSHQMTPTTAVLLFLPRPARRRRHHLRPVLPHPPPHRQIPLHPLPRLHQRIQPRRRTAQFRKPHRLPQALKSLKTYSFIPSAVR